MLMFVLGPIGFILGVALVIIGVYLFMDYEEDGGVVVIFIGFFILCGTLYTVLLGVGNYG